MGAGNLTPEKYYRLPWNLADNAITWLEPTTKCNLYCDGCYRANDPDGHKPLEDVIGDLEQLKKVRKSDGISIAGGEPLIYPHIVDLVGYVTSQGWKPIIITNGTMLNPQIITDLSKAGLVGFTVHVDSHQHRPGWNGKTEEELCELRANIAEMIHEAGRGRVSCSFNATIYRDTLKDIPALTRWAQEHIDLVQTLVFILFRLAKVDPRFDYCVAGRKLDPSEAELLRYNVDHDAAYEDVVVPEVVEKIREACPTYEPSAFLNSNQDGSAIKWLLALRAGRADKILGYMDSRFMEFNQVFHHLLFGTYLAYTRPWAMKNLQFLLPLAPFNGGLRRFFRNWLAEPAGWAKQVYSQTILVLQPPDVLDDGRQAMCDGCPDSMFYKGRVLWKCRLDEIQKFGDFIQSVPKIEAQEEAAPAPELKAMER